MAHQLTIRENGTAEMFSGNNEISWHKLGKVVAGTLTSAEAIQAAQLDWGVELLPIYVEGKEIKDYRAATRSDNRKVLAVHGSRYQVISNLEAFDFFDEVVGSKLATFQTAGSMFEGRKVWIMAKLPGTLFVKSRPDDITEKNVFLYTSHDGSTGVTMAITPVRIVCWNSLNMALGNCTNQIKIRHTRNYKSKLNEAQKALELCSAYYSNLQSLMDLLDSRPMTQAEAVKATEKLIPNTEEKISSRTENIRNEIVSLFSTGKGNRGQTQWDYINGVTEFVDHKRSTRSNDEGDETESRFASAMFGSGAALKNRALSLLVS